MKRYLIIYVTSGGAFQILNTNAENLDFALAQFNQFIKENPILDFFEVFSITLAR